MNMSLSAPRGRGEQGDRARMEKLLRAYPAVTNIEEAQLLRYLRNGRVLDVGLLTANEQLKPQLEQFRRDHAAAFATGLKEYLVFTFMIAAFICLCALMWDAGIGH